MNPAPRPFVIPVSPLRFFTLTFVLPMTFYSTWFFNRTCYSLLLPVVFHLSFNITNNAFLPATLNLGAFGILIAFGWMLMFMILPGLRKDAAGA